MGSPYFRFFDIRIATAVTTAGQLSIRWIENKLNEYMNKILSTKDKDYVIAADTDSIYLSLDKLVSQTISEQKPDATTSEIIKFMDRICENKIQPFIDKAYNGLAQYVNAYSQKMIMKREALTDKGIWTAKKRYILNVYNNEGVEYAKPKIKSMGLELIKSSTPSFCREKLKEAVSIIMEGNEKDIQQFINKIKSEFDSQEIENVSFPRGVNGLEKFHDKSTLYGKGCPIHVRGSLIYNSLIKNKNLGKKYEIIKEGEKIKFIYLKEPNHIQSNVISFPNTLPKELELHKFVDSETQFTKSFLDPLEIILNAIGWKSKKENSLEDFFA